MFKKNLSFYDKKRNYYKNMNFAGKEKFILWISDKKNLDIMDFWSKRGSFSTQTVDRKIFP